MSSGCGCKEVYKFPHITYSYILHLDFKGRGVDLEVEGVPYNWGEP